MTQLSLIETIKQRRPVTELLSDNAIPAPRFPASESREHFFVKHLARNYWIGRGARCVALEVYMNLPEEMKWNESHTKLRHGSILDVMAIRYRSRAAPDELLSIACEVKVSRADFLSGYLDNACDLNYIITQPDIIEADDLPPHVGWLLYDPSVQLRLRSARRAKRIDEPILDTDAALWRIADTLTGELRSRRDIFSLDPFAERLITCPDCEGQLYILKDTPCLSCGGTGLRQLSHESKPRRCYDCKGTGKARVRCKRCDINQRGYGKIVDDYALLTRPQRREGHRATETGA